MAHEGRNITVSTRHGDCLAVAYGDPTGVPTLAIHGWQDNSASFSQVGPLLEGIHLVAVDLPGHGESPWKSLGASYLFADWIVDCFEMVNGLGWDTFQLLGHSMGAGIASLMAGTAPERITRLALIEGLGPLSTPPNETPALLRKRVDSLDGPTPSIRHSKSLAEAIARRVTPNNLITQRSAEILLQRGLQIENGIYKFRHDPRLKTPSTLRFTEEQVLAFLARITAPTLLLKADKGWPFDVDVFTRRVEAVSDCEVREVRGGHHVHLDAPLQALKHLQGFLGSRT